MVTDAQVRKLMDEMSKHGDLGVSAARSGMHRNTARRYGALGKLPSELKRPRSWRTREDAFAGWYPSGDRSHKSPFLEIDAQRGLLIQKLEAEFTRSWQKAPWQWCFRCQSEVPVSEHPPAPRSGLQEL